ncbi:MAG: aspartyl protease family protein [Leadbetterella sp.]
MLSLANSKNNICPSFIRLFWYSVVIFVLQGNSIIYAQKKTSTIEYNRIGYYFNKKRQNSDRIPFQLVNNLIVVKLQIDKSDTLNFILDSGVNSFILLDTTLKTKLNLSFQREIRVKGVGGEKDIVAGISINHKVKIGDARLDYTNLLMLDFDILKLSESTGIMIHGIFGYEFFSHFVLQVNYSDRYLDIFLPEKFKERKSYGLKIPLSILNNKPFLFGASVTSNNKTIDSLSLMVDTGASHALLMLESGAENLGDMTKNRIKTNLGKGLNGDLMGELGRFDRFTLDKIEFKDILVSFPDSNSFAKKISDNTSSLRNGSIGGDFLRRFFITINYRDGYMMFKNLRKNSKEIFEHDMSGLEVKALNGKSNQFTITSVRQSSKAEEAGIVQGDEIVMINNKMARYLDLGEIYLMLSEKAGKTIQLVIKRDNGVKFVQFQLVKEI